MNLNRDLKLIAAALFLWASGEGLFIFILPNYLQTLGADAVQIGLLYSIASVAMAVSMIPSGLIVDRFGPRVILVSGWITGILTGTIMALSPNLMWFSIGWTLYSFTALVTPAVSTYVTRARGQMTPERALTAVFSMYSAGMILSPAIGGMIGERFGLRVTFAIAVIMFTLSTILIFLIKYQPPHPIEDRISPIELVSNNRYIKFLLLVFGITVVSQFGAALSPKFLADVKMINIGQIGWFGSINALGGFLAGQFLGRRPPRRGVMVALILIFIYGVVLLNSSWVGWFALAYFLRGGYFVMRSLISALVTRVVLPSQYGTAMAVSETVFTGAVAIAPAIAGWMYQDISPASPFQLMIVLIPIAIFMVWRFAPKYEGEGRASVLLTKVEEEVL